MDLLQDKNLLLAIIVAGLNFTQMQLTKLVQPKKATPMKGPNGEVMPNPMKML
jgi:hypothetical protein